MKAINVALVGCGYWGQNLLRTLAKLPEFNIVAVCDASEVVTEATKIKFYPAVPSYVFCNNYRQLVSDFGIEAIVIATPPATHFQLACLAIEGGKDVFVEKPMTETTSDAKILIDLAKVKKCKIMTGHTFVYNSGIEYVKQLIDSGEIGNRIFYISFDQQNLGKYQECGVVYDLAAHGLSIADYLLNGSKAMNVSCDYGKLLQRHIPDWASINVHYAGNTVFNLNISWLHPLKVRRLTVVGNKSMVIFDDVAEPTIRLFKKAVYVNEDVESWGDTRFKYTHGDIIIPQITIEEPLKKEMKIFAKYILEGVKPVSDAEQGLRVVSIIEKLHKKTMTGGSKGYDSKRP